MQINTRDISTEEQEFEASLAISRLQFARPRSLPIVLQSEQSECGLACLAMIAGFYKYSIDLVSLRKDFAISIFGADLSRLADIAGRIGLASRALRVDIEELSQLNFPCIVHWNINHFVVLKSVGLKSVVIHDPSYGKRKISLKEFSKCFTGVVLELTPATNFEEKDRTKKLKISDLWSSSRGLKKSLVQLFIISIVIEIFTIVMPLYSQLVIDLIPREQDISILYSLAIGFAFILATQVGTSILREVLLLRLTSQLNIQMASNLFYHLIRLPLSYFNKRHVGDLASRFGSLSYIRQLITTGIVSSLLDGILACITLGMLWLYSPVLTVLVLAVVLLYVLMRAFFYQPFKQLNHEKIIANANESSHFLETLRSVQALKIYQQENSRQIHWLNRLARAINTDIQIKHWSIGFSAAHNIIFGLENILIMLLAAHLVKSGSFTIGMLFAFMAFKVSFIGAVNNLVDQYINFKMLDIHLERISDIAFTEKEFVNFHLPEHPAETDALKIAGQVEVIGLGYRYDGAEEDVFSNISFSVDVGESVAIVGPSGCGKTTLIKCLMGLLEPTAGRILIDGKPLHSLPHYRSQIAGVMQEDQLVAGTIKDNVTWFSPGDDWQRIYNATSGACIHEDILSLPMDYQTLVGDLGTGLSGGQKQRVILARALYRQPRILYLDEATSNLDVNKESLVNEHIKNLSITKILIAHRPETIASADRKIIMG